MFESGHQQGPLVPYEQNLPQQTSTRWWPLPYLPTATPEGPPSTSSSNSVEAIAGSVGRNPQGAAIDIFFKLGGGRYRTYWQQPLGGPPSMSSSNSVVAAAGPADSTPRWPSIDVFFKLGGGHCRTSRQHPLGGLS
jgi:hypothetical protein